MQALAPHLRSPGGAVVNVTSLESEIVYASQGLTTGAYAAAKAGLRLASMCHAVELGRRGIRVNTVAPGLHRDADDGRRDRGVGGLAARRRRRWAGPGARPIVGPPVVFLLSDGAGYITGETLNVGGGMGLGDDQPPR